MFPIKRIEQLHQELSQYYLQVIAFQDKDSQYQDIIPKLSKTISELEDVLEDMRKYNNNNRNDQIINLNK
jgi:CII-binding regulator of phage lambda lysogenization HflD